MIAAEYERGFIMYIMKDLDRSEAQLNQLLSAYEDETRALLYPIRYKILAEKVLLSIEKRRSEKGLFKKKDSTPVGSDSSYDQDEGDEGEDNL